MKDEALSTKEAASLLGVSVSRVRQLAIALQLTRKGRDWYFSKADLIKLKAQPRRGAK